MLQYKNLTVIGTSHIAQQSVDEVKSAIEKALPDIIALELDVKRASALMHRVKHRFGLRDIRKVGLKGFLFALIASWVEEKLGAKVGVKPGSEMKTAIDLARQKKIMLAFIDQDIEVTLKKLSKAFGWREKWSLVKDIFRMVVFRKSDIFFDLRKVPGKNIVKELTSKVKESYPKVYRVLVAERNVFMAKRLVEIMQSYPDKRIVAVIGAGHEDEILKIIGHQKLFIS